MEVRANATPIASISLVLSLILVAMLSASITIVVERNSRPDVNGATGECNSRPNTNGATGEKFAPGADSASGPHKVRK